MANVDKMSDADLAAELEKRRQEQQERQKRKLEARDAEQRQIHLDFLASYDTRDQELIDAGREAEERFKRLVVEGDPGMYVAWSEWKAARESRYHLRNLYHAAHDATGKGTEKPDLRMWTSDLAGDIQRVLESHSKNLAAERIDAVTEEHRARLEKAESEAE